MAPPGNGMVVRVLLDHGAAERHQVGLDRRHVDDVERQVGEAELAP